MTPRSPRGRWCLVAAGVADQPPIESASRSASARDATSTRRHLSAPRQRWRLVCGELAVDVPDVTPTTRTPGRGQESRPSTPTSRRRPRRSVEFVAPACSSRPAAIPPPAARAQPRRSRAVHPVVASSRSPPRLSGSSSVGGPGREQSHTNPHGDFTPRAVHLPRHRRRTTGVRRGGKRRQSAGVIDRPRASSRHLPGLANDVRLAPWPFHTDSDSTRSDPAAPRCLVVLASLRTAGSSARAWRTRWPAPARRPPGAPPPPATLRRYFAAATRSLRLRGTRHRAAGCAPLPEATPRSLRCTPSTRPRPASPGWSRRATGRPPRDGAAATDSRPACSPPRLEERWCSRRPPTHRL